MVDKYETWHAFLIFNTEVTGVLVAHNLKKGEFVLQVVICFLVLLLLHNFATRIT